MDYQVGNLNIEIQAMSDKSITSLDQVIERLTTINNLLRKTSKGSISGEFAQSTKVHKENNEIIKQQTYSLDKMGKQYLQIEKTITRIGKTTKTNTKTFDATGNLLRSITEQRDSKGNYRKTLNFDKPLIQKLADKTTKNSIYAINRLGKEYLQLQTITKKTANGVEKITTEFNEQGNQISKTIQLVDKYGNTTTKIIGGNKKSSGSGTLFNLAKLGTALFLARRIGRSIADIIQYGSDFTETLNMWQVSMRNSLGVAEKFVDTMHRAYGISTQVLMENQAIYKNMLSQMGQLSEETSYMLSEALSRMTLDYASLWNTSIESASEKFKAMLAGQIRPIRSISGISVEEQAIYDIYKQMGGEKTMRQLTQVEKRLLRIYATFTQMENSGATMGKGDFAKTLELFANQSRMISENWKELLAWIGLAIKSLIEASGVLQYINATLITMTEIVKALLYSSGYKTPDFAEGLKGSFEDANDEIDKMQSKLFGFDKFESLGSSNTAGLSIDEKVLELLAGYNSQLGNITNKAQEIANKWLAFLEISREVWYENEEGVKITTEEFEKLTAEEQKAFDLQEKYITGQKFDGFINGLKTILGLLVAIVAVKAGSGIFSAITKGSRLLGETIFDIAVATTGLGKSTTLLGTAVEFLMANPIVALIVAIVGVLAYLYTTNENVRNSINSIFLAFKPLLDVLGKLIGDFLEPIGGLLNVILGILGVVVTVVANNIAFSLNTVMLALTPVVYVLEAIFKLITSILTGLKDIFTFNWKDIGKNQKDIWTNWSSNDYAKESWSGVAGSFENLFDVSQYKVNLSPSDTSTLSLANESGISATTFANTSFSTGSITQDQFKQAMVEALTETSKNGQIIVKFEGSMASLVEMLEPKITQRQLNKGVI